MSNRYIRTRSKKSNQPSEATNTNTSKNQKASRVLIEGFEYNRTERNDFETINIDKYTGPKSDDHVTWIRVYGLHEPSTLTLLASKFNVHNLAINDILDTDQDPKISDFYDFLFVVLKKLSFNTTTNQIDQEHTSLVIKEKLVIIFQEKNDNFFDSIRERIQNGDEKLQRKGTDYLAYILMDAIVNDYHTVLEEFGDRLLSLEESLLESPSSSSIEEIHYVKKEVTVAQRLSIATLNVTEDLQKAELMSKSKGMNDYLKNLNDHVSQFCDTLNTMLTTVSGLPDLYMSSMSAKMEETMKILTMIGTAIVLFETYISFFQ